MTEKRESCPFCGETDRLRLEVRETLGPLWIGWIECASCWASGPRGNTAAGPANAVGLAWRNWSNRPSNGSEAKVRRAEDIIGGYLQYKLGDAHTGAMAEDILVRLQSAGYRIVAPGDMATWEPDQ